MNDIKMLDEEIISDIILCEPITRKGRESLGRLGLSIADINMPYFYNNLRVPSRYDKNSIYHNKTTEQQNYNHNILYYQYTVDYIQFKVLKGRLEKFVSRLSSDSPNEYPLLMLGVAGNGKSIEINRQIYQLTSRRAEYGVGRVYFDLEDAFTKITYGVSYQCPEKTPLWLFCTKLLDGIMQYIRSCHLICPKILDNFNKIVVKNNLASEEYKTLFLNIGNFCEGNNDAETRIFSSLKSFLLPDDVDKNIQTLLETLMWIMYCSAPDKKQYIVIDNIEQYIELDKLKIQIPNRDITSLYRNVSITVMNMVYAMGRIEKDLGWKAFKIIVVLRRTSMGLLDPTLLHSPVKEEQNITDMTAHFQISDIWKQKKKFIWNQKLRNQYNCKKNEDIINIVDIIMNDGIESVGTDYQSIIAPLMSYGIRRNAKAQAHAAYSTYTMLTNGKKESISFEEFNKIMSAISRDNPSGRYMFRRALIEFQFKWSISSGKKDRWMNLGIGHLTREKEIVYEKKMFVVEDVAYENPQCVTLVRRILTYLSYFPEEYNEYVNGQNKTVVDMFSTRSLFDLVQGVLVDPLKSNKISNEDLVQFARVLIALSDMSNGDTKGAPYVILSIRDDRFHENPNALVLAELLNKILEAGYEASLPGEKYNCSDFGTRITDAGNSFLLDWQASFSLMSALHCFTVPSLFFLKDISSIKYVIETVYGASVTLCEMYEEEAMRFCGNEVTLRTGTYLPKNNNEYITFKQRVKDLHMNHLLLYRDYIQKNYNHIGIGEDDMLDLTADNTGFINRYIEKYRQWKTRGEALECF